MITPNESVTFVPRNKTKDGPSHVPLLLIVGDSHGRVPPARQRVSTFTGTLVVLSFIDFDTKRLPDIITIPGTVVFFLAAFAAHDVPWSERAIGAAAGYLFVRLIADFYYYVLKREGLGLGDGKLLALVGAVLGWKSLPVVLFAGSVIGVVVSLPLLLLARGRTSGDGEVADEPASLRTVQVPFGPFLAVGALIYMFAGARILALVVPPG